MVQTRRINFNISSVVKYGESSLDLCRPGDFPLRAVLAENCQKFKNAVVTQNGCFWGNNYHRGLFF